MANLHHDGMTAPLYMDSSPVKGVASARSLADREEVRKHLIILSLMLAITAALRFHPEWMRYMPGRSGMQVLFHLNCPFCGMTRDFAGMLHGQTTTLNPSSWPFAIVVYLLYPLIFFWAWARGRLDIFQKPLTSRLIGAALILMFIANNWRK